MNVRILSSVARHHYTEAPDFRGFSIYSRTAGISYESSEYSCSTVAQQHTLICKMNALHFADKRIRL